MKKSNEKPVDFDLFYLIKSNTPFEDLINKNVSEEESIFHSNSIGIDSIPKIIYNVHNLCFDSIKDADIKEEENKSEKKENFSFSPNNKLTLTGEIVNNNSIVKETPPLIVNKNESENKSSEPKKTLGRKKKAEAHLLKENSFHDKYSEDNLSIKVQRHYLNFIISFLNCLFPYLNYQKKLRKLNNECKINIKKNNSKNSAGSLNDKTIGDIISNKISVKYRSINDKINANKYICEEIKNNPILNKILSEKYLVFFKKFYYNTDTYINLKDYGLNENIIFTKEVKNFKHLLKENVIEGEKYIMCIKEHVQRNYLPDLMFIC